MQEQRLISKRIGRLAGELDNYLDYLQAAPCFYARHLVLSRMKGKIRELQHISSVMSIEDSRQGMFTLEQLAKYNGKNGNPAYVAVNGTVYDVTNNAAWAAATHFGLSAGKDLTGEFASCHAGQQILNKLIEVGKLV